jgi:glycosyltransferase involved in cell wall biosynthesis
MTEPYVSIVSGTYNRLQSLKRMVESVRKSVGVGIPYEIVLVDGGSNDGTLEWIRAQTDTVLIPQGELLGACKAFNAGFKVARGKYVIIANDDVEFRYESIQNSVAFMDDHLLCGIGCFPQNRYNDDYTCAKMPVVRNGMQSNEYYGQVCIVPKWLGDKVGWWGTEYHTYAGDNELSCNVLELGLSILPMESSCINDFQIQDGLRVKNNPVDHLKAGGHPDSIRWVNKWTRFGLLGPNIPPRPRVASPLHRVPRIVYAPLYEDKAYPHQLKTKYGLRASLSKHFLVTEVNYRNDPEELYYTVSMFLPDIVLVQYHDPRFLSYDLMNKMKDEFPDITYVSWNGDYSEKSLRSASYKLVARMFDLATFVCGDIEEEYIDEGINFQYWQIGYEDYDPVPESKIERNQFDIVFLGNCYSPVRQRMGQMLRSHKEWKTGLFGGWPSHIKSNGNTQYDFAAGDVLYRSSKIALGDCLFPNSVGYVSNRLFQALHSGAFLLQQRILGMTELLGLEDGVHLVLWDDLPDLERKIAEWLSPAKESERRKIAQEGKRFVDKNHSFDVRVEELLDMIKDLKK